MDRECNVYHSNCCHTHQPQACGSFSSASTIQFEMIVAKNQGSCSPVYTYTNQRLLSITFHALYPPTCQALKFTTCVFFFWCGAVWAACGDAPWTCARWKTGRRCSPPWKCSNSAPQSAFSGGGGSQEGAYIFHMSSSNPPLPLFISRQLKRPSFSVFFYVDSAPFPSFLFSSHTILFACLCFRLFLFL